MLPADATVVIDEVVEHPLPYCSLALLAPPEWADLEPGQFTMVRVAEALEPFLRRAFSVHDVSRGGAHARVELLFKVVGRGTAALAGCHRGDRLAALGPLGRGFTLAAAGRVALVAGGIGAAPLFLLARRLAARGVALDVFYGGRSARDLPRRDLLAQLAASAGGTLVAVTEDGSAGERGLVTEPFERALAARDYRFVYACGPHPLLARVGALAASAGLPGEAALEAPMGCGFGACLGCAVRAADGGYRLCCKDGPVFRFDEVAW